VSKQAKVEIRLSEEEKARWVDAAGGPRKVSAWLRALANAHADPDHLEAVVAAGAEAVARKSRTPLSTSEAVLQKATFETPQHTVLTKPVRKPEDCPRWMHHRPGTYCGTCQKVQT
jgi:hypothetical protein